SKNAYNVQLHGLKEKKHHVSFPSLSDPTEFVFGIEDLRNGESDEDYNDLILIIDDIDESTVCDYLNDSSCFNCSELPYNKSSRLAFEDQYPEYGDFDYNDVVVDIDYTIVAQQCNVLGVPIYDASYGVNYAPQLLYGSVAVTPVANGALYSLGFAVALSSDYANAEVTVDGASSKVERVDGESIIEFFDFMRDEFTPQPSTIFVNTDPIAGNTNAPAYAPKSTLRANILFNQGTAIPEKKLSIFNPFIFFTDNVQREIHMRNGVLSARGVAQNIVGSPAEGHPYEDDNGIPWAIEINQATQYPVEFQDFVGAYPNYSKWAFDGTHKGWANKGIPSVLY
ncbi:MAG: LruC domain-containing protein, partial [Fibrobacterales bacterium]